MKFEDRIDKIREFEIALYDKLFETFKTSLAYDTRIRCYCINKGVGVIRGKDAEQEKKLIDEFYFQAKVLANKSLQPEEMDGVELKTAEYLKQFVDFIVQIERAKNITARVNKFKDPMAYYNAAVDQNEKTFENFVFFLDYMKTVGELSKDSFVEKNLSRLLSFFEVMIHDSQTFNYEKINEEYIEYLQRKSDEEQRAEEQKRFEELAREQKLEDERFAKSVNDRFAELKLIQRKLGAIGTDRVEELVSMVGAFIEELEKVYGKFPLVLGKDDFTKIMSANDDLASAKMYVDESVSAIFERYKNAEENFVEDLKEKPNGSIRDLFEEFRKRVETLKGKYGSLEIKQDYTPEEVEQIARAYAMTESISADLDRIRESNHFTYGIVE